MTTIADYEKQIEQTFDEVRKLGKYKGHEYAGTADRLANFKRNGERNGITMEQCWSVYAGKHWDAIGQFIKDDAAPDNPNMPRLEPLRGRVHDLIVYLLLFEAMLIERELEREKMLGKRPGVGEHIRRQPKIPPDVYWSITEGGFRTKGGRHLSNVDVVQFHDEWFARRDEFPRTN